MGGFLIFVAIALVVLPFVGFAGSGVWLNIVIVVFLVGVLPVVALARFASALYRRFR